MNELYDDIKKICENEGLSLKNKALEAEKASLSFELNKMQEDKKRLEELGAKNIEVVGNIKLLAKIDQAIKKIKNDTYGYCDETGEPIGIKRLIARPIATLSIEAQEKHERNEKIFALEKLANQGK